MDLHVREVGVATGRPLVVVNGGPGQGHDSLRPHVDALASPARRLVYYDQRGCGASPVGAEEAGWREHVADLDALRAHLGVEAVDVLGFSWGALLALLYALEHPRRVARLVLVSPSPAHSGASAAVSARASAAAARPEVAALRARLEGDAASAERGWRARFALRVAPFLAEPARALELVPVDTREAASAAVGRSLGQFDLRPRLVALRGIPAIVVHGDADPVPLETAADTAAGIGAELVVIERCGHAPFLEAPEAFLGAVRAFLDAGAPA